MNIDLDHLLYKLRNKKEQIEEFENSIEDIIYDLDRIKKGKSSHYSDDEHAEIIEEVLEFLGDK